MLQRHQPWQNWRTLWRGKIDAAVHAPPAWAKSRGEAMRGSDGGEKAVCLLRCGNDPAWPQRLKYQALWLLRQKGRQGLFQARKLVHRAPNILGLVFKASQRLGHWRAKLFSMALRKL